MASPAGPPGGQDNSAASFLGALISLTSHSNIRYQGILSNIDAAHATLSLEKEGRCAAMGNPQDEVPKAENVYDYIVFRAADVVDLRIDDPSPKKDLSVSQQTPSQTAPTAPYNHVSDTAPMGSYPSMYPPMPPHMYGMPPEGFPYGGFAPPFMGHPIYAHHGPNFGAPPPHMQGIHPPPFPPAVPDTTQAAPRPLGESAAASPSAQPPTDVSNVQKSLASTQFDESKPASAQPVKRDVPVETTSTLHPPTVPTPLKPESVPSTKEAPPPQVTQAPAKTPEALTSPAVPTSSEAKSNVSTASGEFDFEKANARFEKKPMAPKDPVQDSGKLSAIPPADTQSFYDKKSGFFDNISSEVKDRLEGGRSRNAIAEEKERNILTFGDEAANFSGPPRRSRGRGHRSRGRGRGGQNRPPSKPEWA